MKNRAIAVSVFGLLLLSGVCLFVLLNRGDDVDSAQDEVETSPVTNPAAELPEQLPMSELGAVVVIADPATYYGSPIVKRLRKSGKGKVLTPSNRTPGTWKSKTGKSKTGKSNPREFDRPEGFVGAESCRECHAENYSGFLETAHFLTSSLPSEKTVRGSVMPGSNTLPLTDTDISLEVVCENDDYFQQAVKEQNGQTYVHREQIAIVTGSGNHGQSYLYWDREQLYELPVTWFAATDSWVHSPGFSDRIADFARPIGVGCLSCHTTRFDQHVTTPNRYNRDTIMLGVSCERCHGPGADHVAFHRQHPEIREAKSIVHPNRLPRERMNDVCGQCHTGTSRALRPPFSFRPGDRVSDFKQFPTVQKSGVHTANQQVRMAMSRCYLETDDMNCATCHNPHRNEHGQLALFSKRCMQCHAAADCGKHDEVGDRISENCIDCHMPRQDDAETGMAIGGKNVFPEIRDHYIRPHEAATRAVLEKWK